MPVWRSVCAFWVCLLLRRSVCSASPVVPHHERGRLCPKGVASGPTVQEHLAGPRPIEYSFWIPLTVFGFLATCIVSSLCLRQLIKADTCEQDEFMQTRAFQTKLVVAAPGVIAFFKLLVVLVPRAWKPLYFLAACYEAVAFWNFLWLILGFVGRSVDDVVKVFEQLHPMKVWAAPPCCCIWIFVYPCMAVRTPTNRDLWAIRIMMWQFMVIAPLAAAIELSETLSHEHHLKLSRLEICSLLLAMYGLFALLLWTHELLETKRSHAKFWMLKGTFIANSAIWRICCEFAHEDMRVGDLCYNREMLAAARASVITVLLCFPLSLLGWYAYSVKDLHRDN